ncbi:hypothetical protein TrST_g2258 [Triparma strigata]|uniref:Uncharacterized protein n=1 Tax=Triparma strigata TaxID=1606541 RepID=A0A9W7APR5_9STRA|nr:hypothetical protein TrST_g2258 [Triparma strigata]
MAPKQHTTGENDAEQVERGTGMIGGQERGKKKTTRYDKRLDFVRRKPTVFEEEEEEEEEVDDDDKRRSGMRTRKRKKKVTEVMEEEEWDEGERDEEGTATEKRGGEKIEGVERDKWGKIIRMCGVAGCQYKTSVTASMKGRIDVIWFFAIKMAANTRQSKQAASNYTKQMFMILTFDGTGAIKTGALIRQS